MMNTCNLRAGSISRELSTKENTSRCSPGPARVEKHGLPKKKRYVILRRGEMSEWSNVPLSKSGKVNSPRGFESHLLRQFALYGLSLQPVEDRDRREIAPHLIPHGL